MRAKPSDQMSRCAMEILPHLTTDSPQGSLIKNVFDVQIETTNAWTIDNIPILTRSTARCSIAEWPFPPKPLNKSRSKTSPRREHRTTAPITEKKKVHPQTTWNWYVKYAPSITSAPGSRLK